MSEENCSTGPASTAAVPGSSGTVSPSSFTRITVTDTETATAAPPEPAWDMRTNSGHDLNLRLETG